uniref:SEP domain-containing protein n=1 Tax=Heterorhabditis bacteriophora TaxID=37862 RepID=A0A1I7WE89_HETBA
MDNHNMFVRRPKPGDSEEDILVMQKEWEMAKEQNKQRATVQVQRMRRSETNTTAINEEGVKTRPNVFKSNHNLVGDWLEGGKCDELAKQGTEKFYYSKDDGFPDVLDLRAYYDNSLDARLVPNGKSFFAAEFERLHGQIVMFVLEDLPCTSSEEICHEDFYSENDKFITNLNEEKVAMFRKEIEEKIAETQMFDINSSTQATETDGSSQPTIDDVIKQLEVLNEFTDRKDEENYNRLAAGIRNNNSCIIYTTYGNFELIFQNRLLYYFRHRLIMKHIVFLLRTSNNIID